MISEIFDRLDAQLTALTAALQQSNPDTRVLQSQFLTLQQAVQQAVLPLAMEDTLAPATRSQIQPLLTEMNRTLRLLGMDVAFLQTAKQPLKVQQRQQQMGQRLEQLSGFCQGLKAALADAVKADPEK